MKIIENIIIKIFLSKYIIVFYYNFLTRNGYEAKIQIYSNFSALSVKNIPAQNYI